MADNLIRGVSHDSLRDGAPTGNLAMRVQHEDRKVLHSVQQHPVFLFALLESFLGGGALAAVAQRGPGCKAGDQNPQQGSNDQNCPGLVPVTLSFRVTQRQQSQFLVLHLARQRLKFIRCLLVPPSLHGGYCRRQPLGAAQAYDHIRVLDSLGCKDFDVGKMALLIGIIRRLIANGCQILRCSRCVGAVGCKIGFLACQGKSTAAGPDTPQGQGQILNILDHFVGVAHPAAAFIGDDHPAIGEGPQE